MFLIDNHNANTRGFNSIPLVGNIWATKIRSYMNIEALLPSIIYELLPL